MPGQAEAISGKRAALMVLLAVAGPACRHEGPPYILARAVVDRHCVGCHSERPTVPAFPIAAGGLALDTVQLMQRYATRIKVRVVQQRDMPDDERGLLGAWVDAGAIGPGL